MARKPSSKRKRKTFDRWLGWGIVAALGLIVLVLWGPLPFRQEGRKTAFRRTEKPVGSEAAPSEKLVRVSIVIDDLGQDMKQARPALSLPSGVTLAVMPGLPRSREVALEARRANHEVLLHLPMEYQNSRGRPSPGMLRSDMTPQEFLSVVSDDVASVPGAIGVNNHEGSSLTENKEAMKFLMAELKARGLMFLDSLTSPRSVAFATAREFGIKSARRDVFLDNEANNPDYIRKQLDELASAAEKRGSAIGIGHPHPATLRVLKTWLAELSGRGIELVPVSQLMK
jgi:uncharacterized protein